MTGVASVAIVGSVGLTRIDGRGVGIAMLLPLASLATPDCSSEVIMKEFSLPCARAIDYSQRKTAALYEALAEIE